MNFTVLLLLANASADSGDTGWSEASTAAPTTWGASPGAPASNPVSFLSPDAPEGESFPEMFAQSFFLLGEGNVPDREGCITLTSDFTLPAKHPMTGGQVPREIVLNLFPDVELTARQVGFDYNFEGSVTWEGQTIEEPHGEVFLTFVEGELSGTIRYQNKVWNIRPDDECGHWIEEWTELDIWPFDCGEDESSPPGGGGGGGGGAGPTSSPLPPDLTDLPTIDVVVVASTEAESAVGGPHGLIGYASNRVHEVDKVIVRTSQSRTHRVRLVHVEVIPGISDPGGAWGGGVNPLNAVIGDMQANLDGLRLQKGGDLMIAFLRQGYDGLAGVNRNVDANIEWDPGLVTHPDNGYMSMGVGAVGVTYHTFAHEFGHSFRMNHGGAGDYSATGYRAYTDTFLDENGQPYDHIGLMASGQANGCRLLAFDRSPLFGWVPDTFGTGQAPCDDKFEPRAYRELSFMGVPMEYRPTGLGGIGGIQMGSGTEADRPNNRFGGDALFDLNDTDPWSEPGGDFHSTLEIVEYYKDPAVIEVVGKPMDYVNPGSMQQLLSGAVTFHWDESDYSAFSSPPPICMDSTLCDLEENPFYLEIGDTWDDATPIVSQWIPKSACVAYDCSATPTADPVYDPAGISTPIQFSDAQQYWGRLWTQVFTNVWAYREFRLNYVGRHVGCDVENPAWVPAGIAPASCPVGALAYGYPSPINPALASAWIDLEASTANLPATVDVVSWDVIDPGNPYDIVAYGNRDDGLAFCCLMARSSAALDVEIRGTTHDDAIRIGGLASLDAGGNIQGAWTNALAGNDAIDISLPESIPFAGFAGLGEDVIQLGAGVFGSVDGSAHNDQILTLTTVSSDPLAILDVTGGGGNDVLVSGGVDGAAVRMHGGGGRNVLCSNRGDVQLVAATSAVTLAHELYVSSTYVGSFAAGTTAVSANSSCGAGVHTAGHPNWAGACTYQGAGQAIIPAECGTLVVP